MKILSFHAATEAIKNGDNNSIFYFSKKGGRIEELIKLARSNSIKIKKISPADLTKLCGTADNKGFLYECETKEKKISSLDNFLANKTGKSLTVLILDGITDPHNLGAILRSSDLFEVDLVILPERRSASENDTVARIASGAMQWVPIFTTANITRAIETLKKKDFWVYGAEMGGKSASSLDLKGRVALVMGSEGKGISKLHKDICDELISIPMGGHIDSLNVSVAAGVLLYEISRQKELF